MSAHRRRDALVTLVAALAGGAIWLAQGLVALAIAWTLAGVAWCALGLWLGDDDS